jgi:transposase
MCKSDSNNAALLRSMNAELMRYKAQVDSQARSLERLISERDQLSQALKEEQAAHQETKRKLTSQTLKFNDLCQEHNQLVADLSEVKHRYQLFLSKEYGPTSERLAVLCEMIPEVLDSFADEGVIEAHHAHADATSASWVDPIDHLIDVRDYSDTDDLDDASPTPLYDEDSRESHDGVAMFLFDADSDGGDYWTPTVVIAKKKRADDSAPVDKPCIHLRPANAGGRNPLPDHLERRTVIYEPPADHPDLANVINKEVIGYRCIEKIDLPAITPFVLAHQCPIYRLTYAHGIVTQQTIAPPSIINRGQVTDHFLVQSAVDKYADHLPSYRQEQRLKRTNTLVARSKLCRWHISLAFFLAGVATAIRDEVFAAPVIGIDDSVHRQPLPGQGRCRQNRIWALTRPEAVYYQITTTRESQWVEEMLAPYSGILMGDACASHKAVLQREDIIALFCWAHVRRYFTEAEDKERQAIMLTMIVQLYAIEKNIADMADTQKAAARTEQALPILADIKQQLDRWKADPRIRPTSGIGKAVTYALNQWHGLTAYCDHGAAPIDNNHTEQCIRPHALSRKNALFNVSDDGTEAYAILLTIIQTAKLNNLDPVTYLCDIIDDLHFKRREPHELTPTAYARRQQADEASQPAALAS